MSRLTIDNSSVAAVLLLAGSGILTGLSYLLLQPYVAWCCLIPLFVVLDGRQARGAILSGALYGAVTALILYSWIVPVATRYSGVFTLHSVLLYGGSVVYFSLYTAAFGFGYAALRRRTENAILFGISISALFTLLEIIRMHVLQGSPWFHYSLALTQAREPWILQWAGVGGSPLIVFAMVLVNCCVAKWLRTKDGLLVRAAVAVMAVCFLGGALLAATRNADGGAPYSVALLNDNIPAEMRWDDRSGDSLAAVLFRMNDEAARQDPDLIVWSETAIPWTLKPDDEFIPAILNITRRSQADHLVGIWSASPQNSRLVYNSAYLVTPSGSVSDRYDKMLLLDFLERPFGGATGALLPFLNTSRYDNILPGSSRRVIASGRAQLGVLICNEGLSEEMYAKYVQEGATLLVLMSNDAWFEGTPLQLHHFYAAALHAVMCGRDLVVNSNRGIPGIVRATGAVEAFQPSNVARVVKCEARPSSRTTVYSHLRDLTVPLYVLLLCMSLVIGRK